MPPTSSVAPTSSKIETHHAKVPWTWVAWMVYPWMAMTFFGNCGGAPLAFTIRKLVESPALVALLSSINFGLIFIVGAISSYMSDRIWTRWGRRRPLLIAGWAGGAIAMAFVPLADSVWSLAALIIIFQFCSDVGSPYEPLYNEVIPPSQRGRASTMRNIMNNLTGLFFNGVMLAQFDRQYDLSALNSVITLNGERVIYWSGCIVMFLAAVMLGMKVRETPPPGSILREPFRPLKFLRDVFGSRQQWMVYVLYCCPFLSIAGIGSFLASAYGAFIPLFQNEQLGFTRQQIGWAAGVVGIVNMVLFVPVWGYLADRMSRLKLFQFALLAPAVVNLALFVVVRFFTHYTLPFPGMIAFAILSEGMMALVYILWGPLIYDYLPSNAYGTASAGFSFVGGFTNFLLINGAGLWVEGFTHLFGESGRGKFDYSSIFVWQAATATLAVLLVGHFAREVKRGKIVAYARLEFEEKAKQAGS
jgi:MFS family permease